MPTVRYKFSRDPVSTIGFITRNRVSTDALKALSIWRGLAAGRSFTYDELTADDADALEALLTWRDADSAAGDHLDNGCRMVGLVRTALEH